MGTMVGHQGNVPVAPAAASAFSCAIAAAVGPCHTVVPAGALPSSCSAVTVSVVPARAVTRRMVPLALANRMLHVPCAGMPVALLTTQLPEAAVESAGSVVSLLFA